VYLCLGRVIAYGNDDDDDNDCDKLVTMVMVVITGLRYSSNNFTCPSVGTCGKSLNILEFLTSWTVLDYVLSRKKQYHGYNSYLNEYNRLFSIFLKRSLFKGFNFRFLLYFLLLKN
jgi:hypothetical protein